jgi:hypothetical protein
MIIYNVTSKVTNNIQDRWLQWMKEDHIPEIMATGLFHDFRICRLLEQKMSMVINFPCRISPMLLD